MAAAAEEANTASAAREDGGVGGPASRQAFPYDFSFLHSLATTTGVPTFGEGKPLLATHLTFAQLGIPDKARAGAARD